MLGGLRRHLLPHRGGDTAMSMYRPGGTLILYSPAARLQRTLPLELFSAGPVRVTQRRYRTHPPHISPDDRWIAFGASDYRIPPVSTSRLF